MLELSLPELGEESKSAKDLIISILLEESPLSIMQLYNKILKNYNTSITYQAVRKAAELLGEKDILIKKQRTYQLNKKWFLKLRSFIDKTLTTKEHENIKHFKTLVTEREFLSFELNSLFELDVFWGDVLKYLANKTKDKFSMNIGTYTWWMLINLGRDTDLYNYFKEKNIKTYFVFFDNSPLNKYTKEVYESLGHKVKLVNQEADPNIAINTVGETIIRIEYPEEIMKEIADYFKTYTKKSLDMPKITKIVHKECKIRFTLYKNKEFAQTFNQKYLNYF